MPTYGPAKVRDMSRSVLASKARKGARENLAAAKRRSRRAVRATIRQAINHTVDFDDISEDLHFYPDHEIRSIVLERRDTDHTAPLRRWAPQASAHVRIEDRVSWIRARMPDNVIGWHATTHVEFLPDMRPAYDHHLWAHRYSGEWWAQRHQQWVAADFVHYMAVHEALRLIIEKGRLRTFNRWIKRGAYCCSVHGWTTSRTLLGAHDIEDFIVHTCQSSLVRGHRGGDWVLEWQRRHAR